MSWPIAAAIMGSSFLGNMMGDRSQDITQRQEIPKWLQDLYLKRIQMANNIYGGSPSSFLSLYGGNQPQNIDLSKFLPQSRIQLANPLQKALAGG